jgi:hypothetical protein
MHLDNEALYIPSNALCFETRWTSPFSLTLLHCRRLDAAGREAEALGKVVLRGICAAVLVERV